MILETPDAENNNQKVERFVITAKRELLDQIALKDCNIHHFAFPHLTLHLEDDIELFVKTLTGKTTAFHVKRFNKVEDLKDLIYKKEGIPPEEQRLIFDGKQLVDGCSLNHYRIGHQSTIYLVLRLRG